ncbi:hypothetical protein PAMP_003488 [Pampus punctatissimus]
MERFELCFPQLNNSCLKPKRPQFVSVLIYILLSSVSVLAASLNLLVIISISHFKELHTPTNFLLISLAVSDFFTGILLFFQVFFTNGCWIFGDLLCAVYCAFEFITTSASVGNIVLISVDRYVAICDPLHYSKKVTQKRVQICVSLCWICSLCYLSVVLKDNLKHPGRYNSCSGECVIVLNIIERAADVILTFILPITATVVLYMKVFVVAVTQARAMRSHIAVIKRSKLVTAKKSEMKAARTLGCVIVVFIMCLCPYFCVTLTNQDTLFYTSSSSLTFVLCLFYFNSSLNPVIYALFYPWFRKSIKLIVSLQILQPDSCETKMF